MPNGNGDGGGGDGGGGNDESKPDTETAKAWQRELQTLARSLRAEGKSDKEVRRDLDQRKAALRREWKAVHAPSSSTKAAPRMKRLAYDSASAPKRIRQHSEEDEHEEDRTDEDERVAKARQLGRKHELVICPIFNKRDEEETAALLHNANELKAAIIADVPLNVWVDQRSKLLPGEKFRYWEDLGVKWRVEIGPRELKKQAYVLVVNRTAGVPGAREELALEPLRQRLRELKGL